MKLQSLATTQFLLSALRADQTPTRWAFDFEHAEGDWNDLTIRAIVFGLAPQLHYRLEQWGIKPPPSAHAKLAVTYTAHEKRNQSILTQFSEAVKAFHQRGLHPIALKGIHLAHVVYETPAQRPMNDIDLLFTQDNIDTAEQILTELGYGAKHTDPTTGPGITKHTSTYLKSGKRGATPNPYLSPDSERMIEPHTSLEESWFGLKTDITPGVHERAVETSLAGVSCRTLSPEDLLLHLSVHFCFHFIMGAPVMVQLLDLLHVTRKLSINYDLLAQRAGDTQATPFLFAALHLAQKLLAAPCPEPFLTKLSRQIPTGLQTYIQKIDLALLLARTQQQPLTNLSRRIPRGLSDRAAAARWAVGLPKKLSVWGTTFVFWKSDTGLLLTGRPLKT